MLWYSTVLIGFLAILLAFDYKAGPSNQRSKGESWLVFRIDPLHQCRCRDCLKGRSVGELTWEQYKTAWHKAKWSWQSIAWMAFDAASFFGRRISTALLYTPAVLLFFVAALAVADENLFTEFTAISTIKPQTAQGFFLQLLNVSGFSALLFAFVAAPARSNEFPSFLEGLISRELQKQGFHGHLFLLMPLSEATNLGLAPQPEPDRLEQGERESHV